MGGGCHWCTEAVFQSLMGVAKVEQGWVASTDENDTFSEAVIVHFDTNSINLFELIQIHLYTHKSTSDHSMRSKYRSAVYYFDEAQKLQIAKYLDTLQLEFEKKLVTEILPFDRFKPSREQITNYYYNNPNKPFCETYIAPKLKLLLEKFGDKANIEKINPNKRLNSL